jgi:hypothetical protein
VADVGDPRTTRMDRLILSPIGDKINFQPRLPSLRIVQHCGG